VKKFVLGGLLAAALLSAAVAGAASQKTPGVTGKTITIGATFPYSGPASSYAAIAKAEIAYYKWVNAHGGVNGRKIKFITLDDGYNPAKTVPLTKQLVEQDHVFAVVGQLGTEPVQSVEGYLNQRKVPQVLVATGASYWGTQYKKYPWTLGWQPDYVSEGALYGQSIAKQKSPKIAVLYQNDDYGKDYLRGFRKGLGKATSKIVRSESYAVSEPSVAPHVALLAATGANTFFIAATPTAAIQAIVTAYKLGWHPHIYLNSVSATNDLMGIAAGAAGSQAAVNGIISTAYTQIPGEAAFAKTPGMKLYKKIFNAEKPGTRFNDAFNVYGMGVAWTFQYALKHAGKNPTRASLMKALLHMNTKANPFLLPGMVLKTSSKDHFPLEQARLDKFANGKFTPFGKLLSYLR
jgi:branched-chain amino acid transport system substrate-binding protein